MQLSRALASAQRAVELNDHLASARVSLGLVLVTTGEVGCGTGRDASKPTRRHCSASDLAT